MIKFAIVGTGWITEAFIQAASLSEQYQLVGVYSRTENKAKQLAKQYNASYYFTDLEEMAKNEEVEAVHSKLSETLLLPRRESRRPIHSRASRWSRFALRRRR